MSSATSPRYTPAISNSWAACADAAGTTRSTKWKVTELKITRCTREVRWSTGTRNSSARDLRGRNLDFQQVGSDWINAIGALDATNMARRHASVEPLAAETHCPLHHFIMTIPKSRSSPQTMQLSRSSVIPSRQDAQCNRWVPAFRTRWLAQSSQFDSSGMLACQSTGRFEFRSQNGERPWRAKRFAS